MDQLEALLRGLPQAVASGLVYGSIYALIAQGYYVTFSTTQTGMEGLMMPAIGPTAPCA